MSYAFTKIEGQTSSGGTGPSAGVGGSGSYLYAEASGTQYAGKLFTLAYDGSACSDIGLGVSTVAFHYHMYGATMGELRVSNAAGEAVWSLTGDQGDSWQAATVDVYSPSFAFEYTRGSDYTGDAAVALVAVSCGAAPPLPPLSPPLPPSPSPPPPSPSPPPPIYTLMSDALSWHDANAACLAAGLQLATVQSAKQNALLVTAAAGNRVWIGATDAASEGAWVWSPSNTPLSYTNWATGQPENSGGEDCVKAYSANNDSPGQWHDYPCDGHPEYDGFYVCQLKFAVGSD